MTPFCYVYSFLPQLEPYLHSWCTIAFTNLKFVTEECYYPYFVYKKLQDRGFK